MINIIDIKKWMRKNIITIRQEENVVDSAKLMSKNKVGSLIVTRNGKPVGIVTQTDIIKRVVSKNKPLDKTKVQDIMTKKLVTASSKDTFTSISKKMHSKKIKHIVIKEKNKMIGIITSTDIIKLMSGKK